MLTSFWYKTTSCSWLSNSRSFEGDVMKFVATAFSITLPYFTVDVICIQSVFKLFIADILVAATVYLATDSSRNHWWRMERTAHNAYYIIAWASRLNGQSKYFVLNKSTAIHLGSWSLYAQTVCWPNWEYSIQSKYLISFDEIIQQK